ncbi:MAG: hypothetical protein AAGJ52_03510 [Pseudomonadota bacterium]
MKLLTRTSTLISCLLLAIACYFVGFPAGGVVFLVIGVIFECLFWLGLFSSGSKSD